MHRPTRGTARGASKNRCAKRGASGGPGAERLSPLRPRETHLPGKRRMPRSAKGAEDVVGATRKLSHGLRSLASVSPRYEYRAGQVSANIECPTDHWEGGSANHRTPGRYWLLVMEEKLSPVPAGLALQRPGPEPRGQGLVQDPQSSYAAGPPRLRRP